MTTEFFKKVLDNTLASVKETLGVKAMEYVRNGNPMHNFETGSRMTGETREKVIHGFALKHLISIGDMRNDIAYGKLPSREMVEEKFGDAINYLILEKASILDKIENKNSDIIVDSDIATVEALHDLIFDSKDSHKYQLTLKRARDLTSKMYDMVHGKNKASF